MGIDWEMAQSLGGMSRIMSPEQLTKLQSGQLSTQEMNQIKASVQDKFKEFVQAKYGDDGVKALDNRAERRELMAKVQFDYMRSVGGTTRKSKYL